MASSNIKLFDENKGNMLSDQEYNIATQRLNGVQTGVASSKLQNKTLYQTSLIAYALAQLMNANGVDANDTAAVSTFVNNLSNSIVQKVVDKATKAEAIAGTSTDKFITPATMKAAALLLSGGEMNGTLSMGNNSITNLGAPTSNTDAATKEYVDKHSYNSLLGAEHVATITSTAEVAVNFNTDNLLQLILKVSGFIYCDATGNITFTSSDNASSAVHFAYSSSILESSTYLFFYSPHALYKGATISLTSTSYGGSVYGNSLPLGTITKVKTVNVTVFKGTIDIYVKRLTL